MRLILRFSWQGFQVGNGADDVEFECDIEGIKELLNNE